MRKMFFVYFVFELFSADINAQEYHNNLPKDEINRIRQDAYRKVNQKQNIQEHDIVSPNIIKQSILSRVLNSDNLKVLHTINFKKHVMNHDTLVIGATPNDSLIISGTYTQNGPIIVFNDGILRFKNADATINGDIIVYGSNAILTADSSTLHFPQQYIYHRAMIVGVNGKVTYNNTTLDYSNLSHGLTITDSAKMTMNNVTNIGFTTCGLSKKPELTINGTNLAGEFILSDQATVTIKHARTVLLWHQVPKTGVLDFSFPKPDTVNTYLFNKTIPGVSGIEYSVTLDTCSDVMWGLMPTTGSDVKISNSTMRAIGVWFQGNDTVAVNGLINKTTYADSIVEISDKKLHLVNTTVQTWSLYAFDRTNISIANCILGEVGAENKARINTITSFLDGTGGYWWSSDSSFVTGYYSYATMVRSEKNSIFLFAYSKLVFGTATAIGNSILIVLQSDLPADPVPYDGSEVWMAYIKSPDTINVDKIIPIQGSAWIDKTSTSTLMDFANYRIFYQKSGDTLWHPIAFSINETRNDTLVHWNTNGLIAGAYSLKLVLCDNSPDSNKVEALKSITLLPSTNVQNILSGFITVFSPNPFRDRAVVKFYLSSSHVVEFSIVDNIGRIVSKGNRTGNIGMNDFEIYEPGLPSGIYYFIIKTSDYAEVKKIVKL